MLQNHDAFLELECAAEMAKGRQANVIGLIKALREHTGMGLKETKDIVDDFLQRRKSSVPPGPLSPAVRDYNAWLREHVARMESLGEKPAYIPLIRDLREHTSLGLKEAKDAVDEFCDRERPDIKSASGDGFLATVARLLGVGQID